MDDGAQSNLRRIGLNVGNLLTIGTPARTDIVLQCAAALNRGQRGRAVVGQIKHIKIWTAPEEKSIPFGRKRVLPRQPSDVGRDRFEATRFRVKEPVTSFGIGADSRVQKELAGDWRLNEFLDDQSVGRTRDNELVAADDCGTLATQHVVLHKFWFGDPFGFFEDQIAGTVSQPLS